MIGENVAQLLQAPVGTNRSYRLNEDEPQLAEELGLKSPIVGTLKLTRTNHGILAEARYSVDIEQECGRCLEPARSTIHSVLSEEFLPSLNIVTGLPETVIADPDEPRVSPNHVLDLTESIRQDIVVQQPLQPLCRPVCPGLCSECGRELGLGPCACSEDGPLSDNPALSRLGD
ncbi:MAG: DUF177 domain-containing protein, partial [Chloroflexota bacterium]